MNRIDFLQTGGFPLETDTLSFLQDSFISLQKLAALGGDNYILSGMVVVGESVSDGYVVIGGELLPFKGGLIQSKVIVRQTIVAGQFENGTEKVITYSREAIFGTGENTILFADLVRLKDLKTFKDLPHKFTSALDIDLEDTLATARAIKLVNDKVNGIFPKGIISMWSGAIGNIPAGFFLCDGQEGRPDLRDSFVLGAGRSYAVGSIGGSKSHTLTEAQLPIINLNRPNQGLAFADGTGTTQGVNNDPNETNLLSRRDIPTFGGGQAHPIMPPYYSLAFIIKS